MIASGYQFIFSALKKQKNVLVPSGKNQEPRTKERIQKNQISKALLTEP
jgi:hypothetical protein